MQNIIKVEKLNKSFKNKKVIEDITFSVKKGSVFGFFGPNGAGKTTTLRIILGLIKADSGEALVFNNSFDNLIEKKQKIGVVLENSGSYESLTAYENLKFYSKIYKIENIEKKIKEVLDIVDLTESKNKKVGEFSTGMKKKLSLARALLSDPEVLFLDEPTTGLDPLAQRDFRELILYLSKNKKVTIFLNTHNLLEAEKICDEIAIIYNKKIKLKGKLKTLLKQKKAKTLEEIYLKTIPSKHKFGV